MPPEPEVLVETQGRLGRITLNRPRAINALTHRMLGLIHDALTAWAGSPAVDAVLLSGAGARGLCAGADIRAFHADALSGGSGSVEFFRAEYRLNYLISTLAKPYLALMDGIVMGGGIGLSAHGSVRIVTERSSVGMPEVTIGLVPDVGGTYLLARAPGELGTHFGLTGRPMGPGDAIFCGFADHLVGSGDLPALTSDVAASLTASGPAGLDAVLRSYVAPAPPPESASDRAWIDECYAADSVEEIVERLIAHPYPAAGHAAETILTKSPTSLKLTLRSLRRVRARGLSLAAALDEEFRVSTACLRSHDLPEGIRAQVIDKDRSPKWDPPHLADVGADRLDSYFVAPLAHELGLAEAVSADGRAGPG